MLKIILGFSFTFFFILLTAQERDSDGDGIIDIEDACPKQAGITDYHGCPGIKEEIIQINQKRQLNQFNDYRNKYEFDKLSKLIIKKIEKKIFESDNISSNDIIIITYNTIEFGQDISTTKVELPKDDNVLKLNLQNDIWSTSNFKYFLQNNVTKKIVIAKSYGNGKNIRISNVDSKNFSIREYQAGKITADHGLVEKYNQELYYYSLNSENNKSTSITNPVMHKYSGLTIYINEIRKNAVAVRYYYNFRTSKDKYFLFKNHKWKEISKMIFEKL